jgi:hypothetical protein
MADDPMTPETCRARAKECRDMGRKERNPQNAKSFEDLAAAWEQLCEELEKHSKSKQ